MSPDKVLVLISSLSLMGFVYWFFLGKKEDKGEISTDIQITVSGGYSPETIYVPIKKQINLTLLRTDSNSCLEELVLPDFKIKKDLPLNRPVTVTFTVAQPGEYSFHCGMNMYHGKIIAK